MKKVFFKNIINLSLLLLAVTTVFSACEKDSDGSPEVKAGNPQFSSIAPDSASGGTVLTLKGSGLGDMRSIVFDKGNVPANFISTLNTENAIVFTVPDTAFGGSQNIVFTNSKGNTISVPFKVIAMPSVSDVSNYDFTTDMELTLTGNNLDDVTSVVFDGTSVTIPIVSKSRKQLVIRMPATDIARAKLRITNASGSIATTQEFISIDNAYQIFTDDYHNGFGDGSWGDPGKIYSTIYKTGTKSVGKTYAKGNWHLINFANWWPGASYNPAYTYLTFWVKGASKDYTLYITGDKRAGGFGNADRSAPINVPADVWTYFKIPLSQLKLWEKGDSFNQLGFWIPGPDAQDETFYFDDVLLVK